MRLRGTPRAAPLDLTALTAVIGTIAVLYGAFRAFYFEGSFLQALSYVSDERPFTEIVGGLLGLTPADSLFGIHVFGDFMMPYYWASLDNPWLQQAVEAVIYPPGALVIFKAFTFVPYQAGLVLFEAVLVLALTAPMILASRGRRWSERVLLVLVLGVLTGPSLATLDRGNIQGLLPLLLFGFVTAVLRQRYGWASAFIIAAASIKLYPIVLVLVLLGLHKWRQAVWAVGGTVIVNLLAVPLLSDNLWPSLRLAFLNPLGWAERSFEQFMSYNVSMAGGVAHVFAMGGLGSAATWVSSHAMVVSLIALLLIAPLVVSQRLELWVRITLAMLLMTAAMPVVFPYALNWVVAAAALIVFVAVGGRAGVVGAAPRWQWLPVLIAVGLLAAPYPIFVPGSAVAGTPTSLLAVVNAVVSVALPLALWAGWWRTRGTHEQG